MTGNIDFRQVVPMITIITDASFCHKTGAGGWAAWAVQNHHRVQTGGQFKQPLNNSTEAEVGALVKGLHRALGHFHDGRKVHILIQSDCCGALRWFDTPKLDSPAMQAFHQAYQEMQQQCQFTLVTRHVKGHSTKVGARYYVNQWCDTLAGKHMRNMRKEITVRRRVSS